MDLLCHDIIFWAPDPCIQDQSLAKKSWGGRSYTWKFKRVNYPEEGKQTSSSKVAVISPKWNMSLNSSGDFPDLKIKSLHQQSKQSRCLPPIIFFARPLQVRFKRPWWSNQCEDDRCWENDLNVDTCTWLVMMMTTMMTMMTMMMMMTMMIV